MEWMSSYPIDPQWRDALCYGADALIYRLRQEQADRLELVRPLSHAAWMRVMCESGRREAPNRIGGRTVTAVFCSLR